MVAIDVRTDTGLCPNSILCANSTKSNVALVLAGHYVSPKSASTAVNTEQIS